MNDKELLKQIGELPREIRPENDPWLSIATRLDQVDREKASHRRFRAWPLSAVAAAAVAVVAVALVFNPLIREPSQPTTAQSSAQTAGALVSPGYIAASEAEYLAAFREFIPVGESREDLPPKAVETIESGWADLLQVENALSTALAQSPDNPFLNQKMLELRARQLSFLRQLAVLDHSNRRLTI